MLVMLSMGKVQLGLLQIIIQDQATRNVAMDMYFNEEYRQCLNDYNHIIKTHSDHLDEIHQQLPKCTLNECKMAKRCNHNDRRRVPSNSDNINDKEDCNVHFYLSLIDRIHFWLYHQFDVGMRIERSCMEQKMDDDYADNGDESKYFDQEFAKMKREITHRRDKWNSESNNIGQSGKYMMEIKNQANVTTDEDGDQTFMDRIYDLLKEEQISEDIINVVRKYMIEEQYDTDGFVADVIDFANGSNMIDVIGDKQFKQFIHEVSQELNGMSALYYFHSSCVFG